MTRIKTGFHRLGILIAIPLASAGLLLILLVFTNSTNDTSTGTYIGSALLLTAAAAYGLLRGVGWVIEGFAGHEQSSKVITSGNFDWNISRDTEPTMEGVVLTDNPAHAPVSIINQQFDYQSQYTPPVSGIGGWLILPTLGTILAPVFVAESIEHLISAASTLSGGTSSRFIYAIIWVQAAVLVGWVVTIFSLYKRSFYYPSMFIGMLLAMLIVNVGTLALASQILGVAPGNDDFVALAKSIGACTIWVPYMLLSKRVKTTFVRNGYQD